MCLKSHINPLQKLGPTSNTFKKSSHNDSREWIIAVIVPCYNESKRIREREFLSAIDRYEGMDLIFVNDGSKDDTVAVLQSMRAKCISPERIEIVELETNRGKAEAVRRGIFYAKEKKPYNFYSFLDADLSTSFHDFFNLVTYLVEHPCKMFVWGARLPGEGTQIIRKKYRHLLGRMISSYTQLLLTIPVYDTQCGAKVFDKEWIGVAFRDPFKSKWLFDVEIFLRLQDVFTAKELLTYTHEYPLPTWIHVPGSKVLSLSSWRILRDLVSLTFWYRDIGRAKRLRANGISSLFESTNIHS